MTDNTYVLSHDYESFIKLAMLCNTDEYGAHNSFMKNLLDKDNGSSSVDHLSRKKLIADVKQYMASATKAAIQRPEISQADKLQLQSYIHQINDTDYSALLLDICTNGCSLLSKYLPR